MPNFLGFMSEAVVPSWPNASKSENLLAYHDVEKTGVFLPRQSAQKNSKQLSLVAKFLLLAFVFASAISFGQPIAEFAARAYTAVLRCGGPRPQGPIQVQFDDPTPADLNRTFFPAAKPWNADIIQDRKAWTLTCSSNTNACSNLVDGDKETDWKSETKAGVTHWITIDLGAEYLVHSLQVTSSVSLGFENGPRNHKVEVGRALADLQVVAYGAWRDIGGAAIFEPRHARYIKLSVVDTNKDKGFVAISEIQVWKLPAENVQKPEGGIWTHTVDFPLVPVTAWLNPKTGRLVTVSSNSPNGFAKEQKPHETVLSEWDPKTLKATVKVVAETNHNIFCPGTSMDENGHVLFTGGSSSDIYSIYDLDKWVKPDDNRIVKARGYQGQTYLSDGRTFMIGGTWSGQKVNKDGEIYDPKAAGQKWTLLNKISADYIKMRPSRCHPDSKSTHTDCVTEDWQQHHPWLFAWKKGTVFHAGPSKQMNWFFLAKGSEDVKPVGFRLDDDDAVCGAAVMYDAAAGSILTAGGAPNYHYWVKAEDHSLGYRYPATNNVFGMTLGNPGDPVTTTKLASMAHPRIFGNAVILPTGEIFIAGGQTKGEGFHDDEWVEYPEIYNPARNEWRKGSRNSIPRTYHSWALLLPDATVIVGGGGLDILRDKTNHYDAQIYQPDYLFKGTPRPKIVGQDDIGQWKLKSTVSIQTDLEVDLDASLIRYSAVTHALNNDLRRIHLKLTKKTGSAGGAFEYTADIPEDPGVALPGYWMLFVLKGGVPSVAKTVRLHKD
ncbi:hypothetical protein QBC47DRAFT_400748 [Echria macrotheca]|uniref:Galactose oxidase n=1 Tax=Echria macrotheca TaxID=438768 RepID=A0AAJ0BF52_9PEZI|nr:hypothetical protein QBC47DRAFT_400748 [Echria macrotheca]